MTSFDELFLLDPQVIFLNHGSFGACPRPVFESYQRWQRELELRPVEFLGRRAIGLLAEARAKLAQYLNAAADDLVFFPNPSSALNMVIRSLDLRPGDEILTTDHEYGALDRTWRFIGRKTGAHYVQRPVPLPVTTHEEFVEHFWSGVTERTKVIFISHITSPTALTFPVQEICARARAAGLISIVDGAHVPGHLPLDLAQVGADFYSGACHKWLCSPKGSAFLHARPEMQAMLEPLVVSWGWESDYPGPSQFVDHHEWQGTRDIAAFLSVPAAIDFQSQHNWVQIQAACHQLASETRRRINQATGLPAICPDSPQWYGQMVSVLLPADTDLEQLKIQLYDQHRIEIPVIQWNQHKMIRVSFQAYNHRSDADALLEALLHLLPAGK